MDELSAFLERGISRHAVVSPESLEMMGKQAAIMLLNEKISLNESIPKLASQYADFNAEQVKRVCEFANNAVYLAIHDKNKTAGVGTSYPQFDIADPARIIQDLSDGAKPTVITDTDRDYGRLPETSKMSSVFGDKDMESLFGKVGSKDPQTKESIFSELMNAKGDLEGLLDNLQESQAKFASIYGEASSDYFAHVKNHLLDNGSFADIMVAARSTGLETEKIASVMQPILVRILKEKIATAVELKAGMNSIEKVAHRIVNTNHPFVTAFNAMVIATDEMQKISMASAEAGKQLVRLGKYMKESFSA